jgi:hypothetical protein
MELVAQMPLAGAAHAGCCDYPRASETFNQPIAFREMVISSRFGLDSKSIGRRRRSLHWKWPKYLRFNLLRIEIQVEAVDCESEGPCAIARRKKSWATYQAAGTMDKNLENTMTWLPGCAVQT